MTATDDDKDEFQTRIVHNLIKLLLDNLGEVEKEAPDIDTHSLGVAIAVQLAGMMLGQMAVEMEDPERIDARTVEITEIIKKAAHKSYQQLSYN